MSELEITHSKLIDKIRTDSFMNQIYNYARRDGISETEMLSRAVIILLNLKEEAFQEKVDNLMRSPAPFAVPIEQYDGNLNLKIKESSIK